MSGNENVKPFEWPVRVYYEDTDAQGVVYYANYFRFMERARTEWLRALGVDQVGLMQQERRIFVVTATSADFVMPARFNDQIVVTARLAGLAASHIRHRTEHLSRQPGRALVIARQCACRLSQCRYDATYARSGIDF